MSLFCKIINSLERRRIIISEEVREIKKSRYYPNTNNKNYPRWLNITYLFNKHTDSRVGRIGIQ